MGDRRSRIKDWPKEDRPREKLIARGPEALGPGELLAILLRTGDGRRHRTALDLGRDLWSAYGEDWSALGRATAAELAGLAGMGPAKAATLAAALELGRRAVSQPMGPGQAFRSSDQVYAHYGARVAGLKRERFFCLLLDARNRCVREETVSEGSLTGSLVHPREAFRAAVREAASAVIFAHNHPSGDPEPSREDIELTRRLWDAGKVLGIRVLDHVVLGQGKYYSFADDGGLPPA